MKTDLLSSEPRFAGANTSISSHISHLTQQRVAGALLEAKRGRNPIRKPSGSPPYARRRPLCEAPLLANRAGKSNRAGIASLSVDPG